jgi:DNA polymerase-1
MTAVVVDYETSVKCPIGNNKAHPMWPANKVVLAGLSIIDHSTPYNELARPLTTKEDTLFIAQNAKFDLLYTYRYRKNDVLPSVWDTQLAEYLLTGQQSKYASLNELTTKYVGAHAVKDDAIKAYWDKGTDTEDIPEAELSAYLKGDVTNTKEVFLKQWAEVKHRGIESWVHTQMDALRATTAMALHGMAVDWVYVEKQIEVFTSFIELAKREIELFKPDLDYKSPKELSLYFFGGKRKVVEREQVGFFKNGRPKFKNVEKEVIQDGLYTAENYGLTLGKNGYYSVDDDTLTKLYDTHSDRVAGAVSDLRTYHKVRDTYYQGLLDLRFPDNFLYPNLNHVSTSTGRLSATQPNLQNQTDVGDVKRAFISRHGVNGSILELDYSQLEMVWLAYIADDKVLQDDINSGRDMHRELYKEMYGRYPTDAERKPFKRFSFLLVYGGGVSTLMAQSGCDRTTARKFIDTFYRRYSGVKRYHESITREAKAGRSVWYDKGQLRYQYERVMPWGRKYVFNSYQSEYTGEQEFSPTELKNYPIQGSATGDMVPMMVGLLQRKLEEEGYYQAGSANLVMTVHDSVVIDCTNEVLYNVAKLAKEVLEQAPHYISTYLGVTFPCRLSVGVEAGPNWQDKKELKL